MSYNGYRNWNQWNVSLWINNDEGLYNLARDAVKHCRIHREGRKQAALNMISYLNEMGIEKTPDGARYSMTAVQSAMRGM